MNLRVIMKFQFFIIVLTVLLQLSPVEGAEYLQMPGVIHIHSTYSSGKYSLPELVKMAESSGIEVLVITDHDWVAMEYGLPPFRRVFKIRKERPSVIKTGVDHYLNQINGLNDTQQNVIVIPGVQSSPFYYWTGNPISDNMTANDFRRELIAVGMTDADDYNHLPVLHRMCFVSNGKNIFLCLVAVFGLGWGVWRNRPGKKDKLGWIVMGTAALVLVNFHPFYSSIYDPYHGPQNEVPFQNLIDYVRARGGMTFWSHPESRYSTVSKPLGPIQMKTEPYPEMLSQTRGYSGFAAIYGDTAMAQKPGMQWDEVLYEYSVGLREKPVWAIAEADYHGTRKNERLDQYQTVFIVKKKTRPAVLDAMAKGRMYAVLKQGEARPVLDDFKATDFINGKCAFSGQEISCYSQPEISVHLTVSDGSICDAELLIIKNGKVIKNIKGRTPLQVHFRDMEDTPRKSFYRLEARIKNEGKIISNPIFVDRPQNSVRSKGI